MKRQIKIKFLYDDPMLSGYIKKINELYIEILSKHYDVVESDEPEYVFVYFCYGFGNVGTELGKYSNCVRCSISIENQKPDFSIYDYVIAGFFDVTYEDRYLYLPVDILHGEAKFGQKNNINREDLVTRKITIKDEEIEGKRFCCFICSNGYACDIERELFFRMLSKYKRVDSGGGFLNNIGFRVKDRIEFEKKYKFSIAFENEWNSFVTEKLYFAFASGTIPIYWGNKNVIKVFNKNAFVSCHEYSSFTEVIERVIELDTNINEYKKMLQEPVFIAYKSKEDYYNELEDFLVNMIETPFEKAKNRSMAYRDSVYGDAYLSGIEERYERNRWNGQVRNYHNYHKKLRL